MNKPLFENLEDCQAVVSILMRRDALDALHAMDKEQALRIGAVLEEMLKVLPGRVQPKAGKTVPTLTGEDRHLDIHEAAAILGYSTKWLYRRAHKLPFTKVSKTTGRLRFSARGLQEWMKNNA